MAKEKLEKFLDGLTKGLSMFSLATMSAGVVLTFVITVARYCFGVGFEWAEELVRMLMLSAAFLMAGPLMYSGGDVCLSIVVDNIKNQKAKKVLDIIGTIATALVSGYIAFLSFKLFQSVQGQVTVSKQFPKQLPYSLVPIGMACLLLYCIVKIILAFMKTENEDADAQSIDVTADK